MPVKFLTSGTVGKPKAFTLSDEQIQARVESRAAAKGKAFRSVTHILCTLSLTSTAGLTYKLWAEKHGVKFSTLADLPNPLLIDGIVSSCGKLHALAKDVHHLKLRPKFVISSGVRVSPAHIQQLRKSFGANLFVSYGASEVGSISVATASQVESIPGCVGTLCPGVRVSFDSSGQVLVKTSTMFSGYDDPALTAEFVKDGWFCTGDLGHMTGSLLIITGRVARK